ncbi:hypothetical protein BDV96DRAFT_565010 [Lophiotrema nucula]|uniref:Uncharacterized protein n=1 Tax=Lophiotrema nucula TaxID=690887 RepID=A0A6A5ZNQ7_9PLEO|nr:hypothetical protein BDV96DRAFT_565010 [Lophiotrema nucula]
MPRQLPWLSKGGTTQTLKTTSKPVRRAEGDIDDEDFFANTPFASSRKGKERADRRLDEDGDDLPRLPSVPSPHNSRGRTVHRENNERVPSSSPPPQAEIPPPKIEYMRRGVSRLDLQDDEWMMVEDEFLQTAKLFTRHLHLAEYERLKKNIEEKKDEMQKEDPLRPVVEGAKPSWEGRLKLKAEAQEKRQKKTLKEVFAPQAHDEVERPLRFGSAAVASSFSRSSRAGSAASGRSNAKSSFMSLATRELHKITTGEKSDSDDLNAPRRPSHSKTFPPAIPSKDKFARPALPSRSQLSTSPTKLNNPSGRTTLDLYDEPLRTAKRSVSPTESFHTSLSTSKPSQASSNRSNMPSQTKKPSMNIWDEFDTPRRENPTLSKEVIERQAKRKAERDKEEEKERRKSVKLDDIPTFLF